MASTSPRFKREARLASSLDHPNICAVYDLACADGLHFIVIQHEKGSTSTKGSPPCKTHDRRAITLIHPTAAAIHRESLPLSLCCKNKLSRTSLFLPWHRSPRYKGDGTLRCRSSLADSANELINLCCLDVTSLAAFVEFYCFKNDWRRDGVD